MTNSRLCITLTAVLLTMVAMPRFAACANKPAPSATDSARFLHSLKMVKGFSSDKLRKIKPQQIPGMKRLNLERFDLRGQDLTRLAAFTSMKDLKLRFAQLNDDDLRGIAGLKQLTHLSLQGTGIQSAGAAHLRGLTNLGSLEQ